MTRLTVAHLITAPTSEGGLGYCCPWFFLTRFRSTQALTDRLGVTRRAVQLAKARVRDGEWKCEGCPSCLHAKVTVALTPRRLPLRGG